MSTERTSKLAPDASCISSHLLNWECAAASICSKKEMSCIRSYDHILRKATTVNFDGLCSADMYPLTPKTGGITPDFLRLVLLSQEFTQYANDESKRTRMPKLNRDQLMAWKQRIPPIDKQRSIIDQLSKQKQFTDDVEKICKATVSEVKALPNLLISRALSGEI